MEGDNVVVVDIVGPYRVIERIGEGGMGVVDLGVTQDGVLVALKSLRPGTLGGVDGRARFEREVAAMRRVHGPRVAEVIDADATADPPYVVTRYVRGMPLSKVVGDHGPLRGDALYRLAEGLAEALSSVHAAGIVHRDVKPGNVLLTDDGPVLIDFGLAHAVGESRLTTTGLVTGTPGYLAPESALGHDATFATDVHGWAATVVFAAAGRSPYGNGPDAVVLDRIRRGEHDAGGMSEPLASLVATALSVDPSARPSLADVGQALGVEQTMMFAQPETTSSPNESPTEVAPSAAGLAMANATAEPDVITTDEVPAVGDAPTTHLRHDATATQLPLRPPQPPQPVRQQPARRTAQVRPWQPKLALGLGAVALVALGAVVPFVGAAVLFAVVLTGRATTRLLRRLHLRRSGQGARPNDSVFALLVSPLDVGMSVIPAAVQTGAAVAVGYVVGALVAIPEFDVPGWGMAPAAVGGGVALYLAWAGPWAELVRYGITALVAPLSRAPRVAWSCVSGLVVLTLILVTLWNRWGTTWWPAEGPINPFQ